MLNRETFSEKVEELLEEVKGLDDTDDSSVIDETAARLEGFNYGPPVLMPVNDFLRCTRARLVAEIDRIVNLSASDLAAMDSASGKDSHELKLQHISVMVFYYKELVKLRRGVPEAWDEVDELYVHD